jgi:hypothetical protein
MSHGRVLVLFGVRGLWRDNAAELGFVLLQCVWLFLVMLRVG